MSHGGSGTSVLKRSPVVLVLVLALLLPVRLLAAGIISYHLHDVTLGAEAKASFNDWDAAFNSLKGSSPQSLFGTGYQQTDYLQGTVYFKNFPLDLFLSGTMAGYMFRDKDGNEVMREFSGGTRDEAIEKLLDYLKSSDGQEDVKKLLEAIQQDQGGFPGSGPNSPIASSTNQIMTQQAMGPSETAEETEAANQPGAQQAPGSSSLGVGLEVGWFKDGDFEGKNYTLPLSYSRNCGPRWKMTLGVPITYTEMESAVIYRFGMDLSLAFTAIGYEPGSDFKWVITPTIGGHVTASEDLLFAGFLYNYGVANRFEKNCGPVRLSFGTFIGHYESAELDIGDYSIDLGVYETILANGLKAAMPIARRWVADVYVIDTRSLEGVMDAYQTYAGGIAYRAGVGRLRNKVFRVGIAVDDGADYSSVRGEFSGTFIF